MALVLFRPLFWLALALQLVFLVWLAYRLRLRWLPALFLRLLFVAAILFPLLIPELDLFQAPVTERQVLVVDVSDSITTAARAVIQSQAQVWQESAPNRLVVLTGATAQPVQIAESWPAIDGLASNLAAALQLAMDMHGGRPGKIILASDGVATGEQDTDAMVARLAASGYKLDVIPLAGQNDPRDVFAGALWLPPLLWEGGPFSAVATVYALQDGEIEVSVRVNGEAQASQTHAVVAGANYLELPATPPRPGILTMEVMLAAAGDPRPENNIAAAAAQIFDSPHVLFITDTPDEDEPLLDTLRDGGIEVVTGTPDTLTTNPAELAPYQVIFLNNLLAQRLSPAQISALDLFVSQQGGGLIFLGGFYSYTLGGYQNSPLAPLLPVKLEPPPRLERPPVTFAIIFDRSQSMTRNVGTTTVIALAREAASRAIEVLNADDYIGIMTYNSEPEWNVPVTSVVGGLVLLQAQDTINRVEASGGTDMLRALEAAVAGLEGRPESEFGLILLLSDGKTGGSQEQFASLARRARANGLHISTITLVGDAEAVELMAMIADEGGGRMHNVSDPAELPRIMVEEGQAASGDNVQEGVTALLPGEEDHPALAGINLAALPAITGYNGLTSKRDEGAEDILVSSSFGDPVLSGWQVGLGRVVAWTSDAGVEWATRWRNWDGAPAFWSQIVRYALLNPSLTPAHVAARGENNRLVVDAQLLHPLSDEPYNWAAPEFIFESKDGAVHLLKVPQVAPGTYHVETSLAEPGAYRALLRYRQGNELVEQAAPFVAGYPAEWRPDLEQVGQQNLERWAAQSGGSVVDLQALPQPAEPAAPAIEAEQLLGPLMWALIIFWPVEIALRRRWLPWPT
jgi:uncharacterized membrane protein